MVQNHQCVNSTGVKHPEISKVDTLETPTSTLALAKGKWREYSFRGIRTKKVIPLLLLWDNLYERFILFKHLI